MVGMSGGMANQPVKAIKKDSHERCIALICGRANENSFMLVAFPSSSTRICFGKIFVASVILCVGYFGEEVVFFCGDFENPFTIFGIYLCKSRKCVG